MGEIDREQRTRSSLSYLSGLDLDVIALQEVHVEILNLIVIFFPEYTSSTIWYDEICKNKYGVLLLWKNTLTATCMGYHPFASSFMNRGWAWVTLVNMEKDVEIADDNLSNSITIFTSHLESMSTMQFAKIRETQIAQLKEWCLAPIPMSKTSEYMLGGLDANQEGILAIPLDDVWHDDPQPTWHANRFFDYDAKRRYDRILYRGTVSARSIIENTWSDHDILIAEIHM